MAEQARDREEIDRSLASTEQPSEVSKCQHSPLWIVEAVEMKLRRSLFIRSSNGFDLLSIYLSMSMFTKWQLVIGQNMAPADPTNQWSRFEDVPPQIIDLGHMSAEGSSTNLASTLD